MRPSSFLFSFPSVRKSKLLDQWNSPDKLSKQERIAYLKQMVDTIRQQIDEIDRRIKTLESGASVPRAVGEFVAVVLEKRCDGCGVCAELCPQDAVFVYQVATVDPKRCKGCGLCSEECPQNAIILGPKGL